MIPPGLGGRLLGWYERNRRALPWRESRDPWAIWVSEVMLQQTRVETATPFFVRFLEQFPNVEGCAAAELGQVLAAWSGLGYYRRARQLHAAARELVARRAPIPRTAAELARLPGIGPYTAAAIASISFGEASPVLDGNVARVLTRFAAEAGRIELRDTRSRLLAVASGLLDPARPGDSNQALMELGATLCLPRAPRCELCPLHADCRAHAAGEVERYPVKRRAARATRVAQTAAVVEQGGRRLLFRRGAEEAQLAGLWELPLVDAATASTAERALEARFGGEWRLGERLAAVRHTITTRSFAIVARRASYVAPGELAESREAGWFDPVAAAALPLSGAARKLLSRLSA